MGGGRGAGAGRLAGGWMGEMLLLLFLLLLGVTVGAKHRPEAVFQGSRSALRFEQGNL